MANAASRLTVSAGFSAASIFEVDEVDQEHGAEEESFESNVPSSGEQDTKIVGFIIGEVRDWEFGSRPCGWVFALGVRPDFRLSNVATRLYFAMCVFFKRAGVGKVRTMVARHNNAFHSFFRSQGMMAGPYVQLEKDL